MATGYTHPVCDGEITELKDFVLSCARAMGPFVMQRDDAASDLPKKMDERSWAQKSLDEYRAEKIRFSELTDDQRHAEYVEYAQKVVKQNADAMREAAEKRERLENMLAQVKAWRVTDENLEPLRKFMIEQLETTIDFDGKPYTREIQSFGEWLECTYDFNDRMVATYRTEVAKERERTKFQHEYTEALYKSLGLEYNEVNPQED